MWKICKGRRNRGKKAGRRVALRTIGRGREGGELPIQNFIAIWGAPVIKAYYRGGGGNARCSGTDH